MQKPTKDVRLYWEFQTFEQATEEMSSGQKAFRDSHTVSEGYPTSLPVGPEFFTGARPWRGERDQALKQQMLLLSLHSQYKRTH